MNMVASTYLRRKPLGVVLAKRSIHVPRRKHFLTRHDILLLVRFELLSIRIEAALRLLKIPKYPKPTVYSTALLLYEKGITDWEYSQLISPNQSSISYRCKEIHSHLMLLSHQDSLRFSFSEKSSSPCLHRCTKAHRYRSDTIS